jgi:hypothetical protein
MDLPFARTDPARLPASAGTTRTTLGGSCRNALALLASTQCSSPTARIAARLGASTADACAGGMLAAIDGAGGWLELAGASGGSFHPRTAQTLRQMS